MLVVVTGQEASDSVKGSPRFRAAGIRAGGRQLPGRGTSWFCGGLFLWLTLATAWSADPLLIRSQSGQFVVRGLSLSRRPVSNTSTSRVAFLRLDPTVLVVTLERLFGTIARYLG